MILPFLCHTFYFCISSIDFCESDILNLHFHLCYNSILYFICHTFYFCISIIDLCLSEIQNLSLHLCYILILCFYLSHILLLHFSLRLIFIRYSKTAFSFMLYFNCLHLFVTFFLHFLSGFIFFQIFRICIYIYAKHYLILFFSHTFYFCNSIIDLCVSDILNLHLPLCYISILYFYLSHILLL